MSRDRMVPPIHYTPYSKEWFTALAHVNAALASEVMWRVEAHGKQCCMVCGSTEDVEDYYPKDSPFTRRLCDACYMIQENMAKAAKHNGH